MIGRMAFLRVHVVPNAKGDSVVGIQYWRAELAPHCFFSGFALFAMVWLARQALPGRSRYRGETARSPFACKMVVF